MYGRVNSRMDELTDSDIFMEGCISRMNGWVDICKDGWMEG